MIKQLIKKFKSWFKEEAREYQITFGQLRNVNDPLRCTYLKGRSLKVTGTLKDATFQSKVKLLRMREEEGMRGTYAFIYTTKQSNIGPYTECVKIVACYELPG